MQYVSHVNCLLPPLSGLGCANISQGTLNTPTPARRSRTMILSLILPRIDARNRSKPKSSIYRYRYRVRCPDATVSPCQGARVTATPDPTLPLYCRGQWSVRARRRRIRTERDVDMSTTPTQSSAALCPRDSVHEELGKPAEPTSYCSSSLRLSIPATSTSASTRRRSPEYITSGFQGRPFFISLPSRLPERGGDIMTQDHRYPLPA